MRDFIGRQHHPQPPSHIPPHDLNMRRSSEVYQSMPPPPPEIGGIIDADVFRPDESSEVPFSSHAAALFASRATSTMESTSQRRPDPVGRDRISDLSYYPWESRFEENFAFSARRHRANAGERRHRNSPEPERSSSIRRLTVAEPPTPSAPATRTLDIEEFQHGPFRATLERLERQGRQDQQMMMERQAEIDRLRSRLDELQSQERPVPSSRAPTLPPLRLDFELSSEAPQRMPSPTHPDSGEASSSFRAYLEAAHRRRSWQRGRATRPPSGDEPVAWRDSSGPTSSTASLPISRARSPPHAFPESRNIPPAVERERERRRRPGALELWSPGEADDAMDSLRTSSGADGSFITRSFARMRGEFQNMEGQQPRREPRGNAPWGMDSGRLALREPHVDALRGVRPLWATHAPDPWGTEMRDEILAAGSSATDAPVRGRRRRANQSTVPPQGRNVSEDERPAGGRRAFSTSRYAAARRVIHDPVFDRVQRIVRGSPREGGLFGRYGRRNAGDFIVSWFCSSTPSFTG
ncbi:hypothetical protein F5148DRAFT_551170 [Russula earlei]|uniref:Uncharacterized protein n=1 Tax=Russula earlei TaxID=71964 RepID=A0ACC0TW09_9AGAM|nr:hypothetical protein F5148DRAFT_551170 [Russula earlei]